MAAGMMVEAGQGNQLRIRRLKPDRHGAERFYRFLGAELTFHGGLAKSGETLRHRVSVNGQMEHGGTRLCSFEYVCQVGDELRLSVRDAQVGFFTRAELATGGGVRWNPAPAAPPPDTPWDGPHATPVRTSFRPAQVLAFTEGRPEDCFGPRWKPQRQADLAPRVSSGCLSMIHDVNQFHPRGGPWGRGLLRASATVRPDDWFFSAHFPNDPCMPDSLT
jgi:hypothetical protein